MFKKIISLIIAFTLSLSVFCIGAFADDGTNADEATTLTFDEICTALGELTGVDYSGYNYYITRGPAETFLHQYFRNYSIVLCQRDPENEVHIINDNYAVNQESNNIKIVCTPDLNSTYTAFNFRYGVWFDNDNPDIWSNWESWTRPNNYPETLIHVAETTFFESNMPVYVNGDNINETAANVNITYLPASRSIVFTCENLTDDREIGFLSGITGYIDNGMIICPPDNGELGDNTKSVSINADTFIEWSVANNVDYSSYIAYITAYDGINPVASSQVDVGSLLDGSDGEIYDEKKPYESFPDPDDYFNDPPDFPDLDPFPSPYVWDPDEDVWTNLYNLLVWLADFITTPIRNILKVLRWVVDYISYYIFETVRFLKDCFLTLVHNIGIALSNLVVDLKGLITRIFVPRQLVLDSLISKHFPIINQVKLFFERLSLYGSHSIEISFNFLGVNVSKTVSFLSIFGEGTCNNFRNFSIYAMSLFYIYSVLNCIFNVFDMGVRSE